MSIVSQRSANQPRFTDSAMRYYYSFMQPPAAWSAQSPGGITMDDKIMPNRDIDDAANGTDTWRVLRGVDLCFAVEGALERYYACQQFQSPLSWPTNQYMLTRSRGYLESELWRSVVGGLQFCYGGWWLKNISTASDLQASYSTWADGTPIDGNPPAGSGRDNWWTCLDWAAGKWTVNDMASNAADFAAGTPLAANAVRRVYYDLERLQWYVTSTGWGSSWKVSQASTTAWARSSWSYLEDYTPLEPLTGTTEIWHEERRFLDVGEPEQRGGWWGYYTSAGVYQCPRTGLLDSSGSRTDYFGSEQACYLALHLVWGGGDMERQDKYEYWKVPYSVTALGQVQVAANQASNAAYSMVNKYGAGVPRQVGEADRFCSVYIDHVDVVCKVGDRTDVSQLGWRWTP